MLMDRMGLTIPSAEQMPEVESVAITEGEYETDLELAKAIGCVILHSKTDMLSEQHIAIYPATNSATVWWKGQVKVEQGASESDGLVSTQRAPGIGRNDGLSYDGVHRRVTGPLPFRRHLDHLYVPAEEIIANDRVGLRDGQGQAFESHPIHTIEHPSA